jgi:hypothetical protein
VHATNGCRVIAVKPGEKLHDSYFYATHCYQERSVRSKLIHRTLSNTHADSECTALFTYKVVQNLVILSATNFSKIC